MKYTHEVEYNANGRRKYPFAFMEVGDDFHVPYEGRPRHVERNHIRAALRYYNKNYEFTGVIHEEGDFFRVERIA